MKTKIKIIGIVIPVLIGLVILFISTGNNNKHLKSDRPDGYFDYFHDITTPLGLSKSGYTPNYAIREFQKALSGNRGMRLKSTKDFTWISRGPGNVGGRTRTVLIDPDDPTGKTWFAGSVGGGVWKTTDNGNTWLNLTPSLPNLSTASLSMAPSNTNIIYAGTGEGYGGEGMIAGNGIFVSRDKGASWEHIDSTSIDDKFRYVNKILVSETKDSVLLVASNKGIYKTYDAGNTWQKVDPLNGYSVQDLAQNPKNPNVIYAGVNSYGVLKSYDFGSTWVNSSEGIAQCYRVALSVSPVDTSYVYAGIEAPGLSTHIYSSQDGGATWRLNYNSDGLFIDFHGTQGWFNDAIAAHPFDKNKVYVGGVYFGMLEFKRTTYTSNPDVVRVDTIGTGSIMSFMQFGGSHFRGALATGFDEELDVENDDFVCVEIRFKAGLSQKAHRFTVPDGEGAGVPREDYKYKDYVDVPFEVWDVENNRQLMVSFRDQDKNGEFNLVDIEYDDNVSGREYFFVNGFEYDPDNPQEDIALDGGHFEKLLYFMWPVLPSDTVEWDPSTHSEAKIVIKFGAITYQEANTTVLADERLNENLHVDHHDIKFFITDDENKKFNIIEANDGGLGYSEDEGKTWEQINKGYLTTQFYGVAKRPGMNQYIGGMQDNGTWQSPINNEAYSTSEYSDRIAGDGFEALWHPWYPNRILGSSYNNYIQVSNDYGETWQWADDGINGDGPFLTKLSHSRDNPNLVFAVGSKGVFYHKNFAFGRYSWQLTSIGEGWTIQNAVTSMHNVKVSLADSSVIWAGAGMYSKPDLHIFLSRDFGITFDSVSNFLGEEMGFISGFATHPTNPATAFALFSFKSKPKILRTQNYGETWEDISGFGNEGDTSTMGFPDVMVNDLLVLPNDTNTIWAATEIGIFELNLNDSVWKPLGGDLPPVSVWQLDVIDNQIIAATHGRGVWTANIGPVSSKKEIVEEGDLIELYPNPASDLCKIRIKSDYTGDCMLKIYSISGKLLKENKFNKNSLFIEQEIDLSALPVGNYLVSIISGSKKTVKKLIVSQ